MKPPNKWEPTDEAILSYGEFESATRGDRVVFVSRMFKGRAVSCRVVANMSYHVVTRLIRTGRIFRVQQTAEYREWLREELL